MDKQNPLNFVSLYEDFKIVDKENISFLYPQKFEENIIKIYVKEKKYFDKIKNIVKNFLKK